MEATESGQKRRVLQTPRARKTQESCHGAKRPAKRKRESHRR